jgi:hypothetical protein
MTRYSSNVVEGKSPPFPAGVFVGKLTEAKEEWYSSDKTNPDGKDSVRLNLTFKEITPLDGAPQVGTRPLGQRIDVVVKKQSIVEIEDLEDPAVPFNLRQSATLVIQLALALGVATRNGDGTLDFEMGPFLEALSAGNFTNQSVRFAVEQRQYGSKTQKNPDGTAKQMTASNITTFSAAKAE